MDYTTLKKQEPIAYTFANLTDALEANNYDYMCENPWSDGEIEAVPGIEINKDSLSEIISRAVREALAVCETFKGENLFVTPKIEKYHIKHK